MLRITKCRYMPAYLITHEDYPNMNAGLADPYLKILTFVDKM